MTFKSSNSEWIEALSDRQLVAGVRLAMGEGCIRPCRVFDQIDELLERFCKAKGLSETAASGKE